MKILHIADLHVGAHNLEQKKVGNLIQKVSRESLIKIAEKIVQYKPDVVIIAGDLFHVVKDVVSLADLTYVTAALKILREHNIPVIAIEGNHDKSREIETPKGKILMSPIRYLESLGYLLHVGILHTPDFDSYKELLRSQGSPYDNVKVKFSEIPGFTGALEKFVVIENTAFMGIDHKNVASISPEISERLFGLFRNIGKIPTEAEKKVFIAHQTFDGIVPKEEMFYYKNEALSIAYLPDGFDYYALGHIHEFLESFKEHAHIIYPGIITPLKADEFDYKYEKGKLMKTKHTNKGMILYDLDQNKYKRIKLKGFRSIRISILQESSDIQSLMVKINSAIQRSLNMAKEADLEEGYEVMHPKEGVIVDVELADYGGLSNVDLVSITDTIEQRYEIRANINFKPLRSEEEIPDIEESMEYYSSSDLKEILKNAFGESYPLYLRFIELIGSKKDVDLQKDSKIIIEAVKDALSIIYGDHSDSTKALKAFAKHVVNIELLEDIEKEEKKEAVEVEEGILKEEVSEVKKEVKEKPKKKGMKTLFDLG